MKDIDLVRLKEELEDWRSDYYHPADKKQHDFFMSLFIAIEQLEAAQRERDALNKQLEAAQRERDEAILLRLEVSGALSSATDRYEKAEAEIKRRDALEPVSAPKLLPEQIIEIMQDAWNEWCDDTGCYPDDFEYKNGQLFFDAGRWANLIAERVVNAAAPAAVPEKLVKLPEMYAVSIDRTELIEKSAVMVELDAAGVKWVEGDLK